MSRFNNSYGFTGIPTFLHSRYLSSEEEIRNENFDIAVMGVPFDEGCPFQAGQRFAPRSLREQSMRFSTKGIYRFDEDRIMLTKELAEDRIVDIGDPDILPTDIIGNIRRTSERARMALKKGALLIGLGGDHSVTHPLVDAFDVLDEKIHVVHFDSHPDFRPLEPEFRYSNGHPFMHVFHMEHVSGLTQIGIRSNRTLSVPEARAAGVDVIGVRQFRQLGAEGVVNRIPKDVPCYVSIDIDVLDPSLVPGCVSCEPNGLMYQELIDTLSAIATHNRVVGFDLVEIAPELDVPTNITSYMGAEIILEFLASICDQPGWKKRYQQ